MMTKSVRPSRKEYYCPSGFTRLKLFLKILWVNLLWHWRNPYGYCNGYNWSTCISIPNVRCPCVKYSLHCEHIFSLYDPRFDSREVWEQYAKLRRESEQDNILKAEKISD